MTRRLQVLALLGAGLAGSPVQQVDEVDAAQAHGDHAHRQLDRREQPLGQQVAGGAQEVAEQGAVGTRFMPLLPRIRRALFVAVHLPRRLPPRPRFGRSAVPPGSCFLMPS